MKNCILQSEHSLNSKRLICEKYEPGYVLHRNFIIFRMHKSNFFNIILMYNVIILISIKAHSEFSKLIILSNECSLLMLTSDKQ